jgi:hypothetical protein
MKLPTVSAGKAPDGVQSCRKDKMYVQAVKPQQPRYWGAIRKALREAMEKVRA